MGQGLAQSFSGDDVDQGLARTLDVGEQAGLYFGEQFHCAEAVAKAVLEALGRDAEGCVACATSFGGGFGKSFQETCGALSGALIAIGHIHGRRRPGDDWNYAADLGADIRETFLNRLETTHCLTLRERFGQEAQMDECRNVVRFIARETLDLLDDAEAEAQP